MLKIYFTLISIFVCLAKMKLFGRLIFGFFISEKIEYVEAVCRDIVEERNCGGDYHAVDGRCLKLSNDQGYDQDVLLKNWEDARDVCQVEGGRLATVTSQVQDQS